MKPTNSDPSVLHIVWDLMRGGTEGQCARMAMACRKMGLQHDVAVFRRSGFFLSRVESVCGEVFEIPIQRFLSWSTLSAVRNLAEFIRERRTDLVHTWDADASIFGGWAARMASTPYVTSRRDLGEIYPFYKKCLMGQSDRAATSTVVNAEAIEKRLLAGGLSQNRIHVLPNAIDIREHDADAQRDYELPEALRSKRLVGIVTRLDVEKDVALFLRAARRVLACTDSIGFVIAGDGTERNHLECEAARLGVDHAVSFLGEVDDVAALIHQLEVGVLVPRENEGLSNTIIEYMAGAKPVVATDCGGNAELVVHEQTGLLIKAGDEDGLVDAIDQLLAHPRDAAAMGAEGRKRVEVKYALPHVAVRFREFYRNQVFS